MRTSTRTPSTRRSLSTPKELWVFWYSNEEPEIIQKLLDGGLIAPDETEMEGVSEPIKYETRTLYFKALHNQIERNMLKRGYVRFGRWFTRPLDESAVSQDCALPAYIMGVRYEFMVLGENHVCTMIKSQAQPPILRLAAKHLRCAKPQAVILGPWSLRAVLLPNQPLRQLQNLNNSAASNSSHNSSGFSALDAGFGQQTPEEVQQAIQQSWDEWKRIITLPVDLQSEDEEATEERENASRSKRRADDENAAAKGGQVPKFVLVEVDGIKMFYPSCFVGIVAPDPRDSLLQERANQAATTEPDLHDSLVGFSATSQLGLLELRQQKTNAAQKRENFVPEILRHSRKSYVGDACITAPSLPLPLAPSNPSIGLNVSDADGPTQRMEFDGPPPINRMRSETGLHLSMPSTSAAFADELRQWNYFDYQRREMCYCKNCSPTGVRNASFTFQSEPDTEYVFHRAMHGDQHPESLYSPHQLPPSNPSVSAKQLQEELQYLKRLDERERQEELQHHRRTPIFARAIPERTSIVSKSLNFQGVLEPEFKRTLASHFHELDFDHDAAGDPEAVPDLAPFTPVTSVTPDLSEDEGFYNNPALYVDDRTFAYDPTLRDPLQKKQPFHILVPRTKPIGPPPKERVATPAGSVREERGSTGRPPVASSAPVLRSLLEAVDDCTMPLNTPSARLAEEKRWIRRLAATTRGRRQEPHRLDQSSRELRLRAGGSAQSLVDEQFEHSRADGRLQPSPLDRTAGGSMPRRGDESMDFEASGSRPDAQQTAGPSEGRMPGEDHARHRRFSAPTAFSPFSDYERANEECAGNGLYGGVDQNARHAMERLVRSSAAKHARFVNPKATSELEREAARLAHANEYAAIRQAMHDDLVEVDDPKTPITNLNASTSAAQPHAHHSNDNQQMFTSAQTLENAVHSVLSPPASNEQAETAPEKAAAVAQQMAPVGNLLLHTAAWNTNAVSTNTAHDSLSIIYPTPPTPMQQFSPQNAVAAAQQHAAVADEPSTSKRRRVQSVVEGMEAEEEDEASSSGRSSDEEEGGRREDDERSERSNGDLPTSGFLSMEDLAAEILFPGRSRSISPVFCPKMNSTPPLVGDRFVGDLLDADLGPKQKLRWLKHLKKESRQKVLKRALRKRSQRRAIPQPPDYLLFLEKQSRMAEQERRQFGTDVPSVSKDQDILRDPLERLIEDALELRKNRKPIRAYGSAAAFRLNKIYAENKRRETEQQRVADDQHRQLAAHPHPAMMRQFSAGGMTPGYNPQMQQNPMMMHGQPRPNYNPYMHQQQFAQMTPQQQQQMMIQGATGPHMAGPPMSMMPMRGAAPPYGPPHGPPQYMHQQNAGMSPSYPQMMPPNANFGPPGYQQFRPPFPQQQQPPFNVQQQQMMMQQRMGGHGSPMAAPTPPQPPGRYAHFAPSPASSIGSNQPPGGPQHPMGVGDPNAQRPGSVAPASNSGQLMPRPGSTTNPMTAPSPFGSPATAQQPIGSVGAPIAAQRTPSMPPSVPVDSRNVFSVENSLVGQRSEVDQSKIDEILAIFQNVKTRNITVLLRDTVADLFYDSVFDACPICSCNANIRSSELGLYLNVAKKELDDINAIQSRQQQDPTFRPDYWNGLMARGTPSDCSCGFSAVRHRYLCGTKGLFLDDIREALGGNPFIRSFVERNRRKGPLLEFVDCLRFLSASRNLATAFVQATYLGDLPDSLERPPMYPPQDMGRPKALPDAKFHPVDLKSDYVVSRMDDEEMNIAMRFSLESAAGRPPKRSRGLLHNWGYQLANGVREPKDQEYMAVVREVQGVLEHAMKEVRGIDTTSQTSIVEGPLTLRSVHRKAVKSSQDDDSYKPEQIPQILVSADRDPIATNPQLVHMWEKLTMGPYDQAKDVLYVAVVPDSTVVVEKCKIFLEELSTVYEKCRFGRHVKLATRDAPRDGIIRVSMKSQTSAVEQMGKATSEDDRRVRLRMFAYFDAVLHELQQAITHRDHIFERRAYFETLYRDSLQTSFTTLASNSDDTNMPPPQIRAPLSTGIGAHASPSSVLSSASGGPASAQAASMGSSLFVGNAPNSQSSPAVHPHDGSLIEPLRTPEAAVGTPQQADQQPPSVQAPTAPAAAPIQLSDEAVGKAVDEMLSEDHHLALPHMIVVYLVNPFTFGSENFSPKLARAAWSIMMKTFNMFLSQTAPHRRPQIQLELVNLQTLYDYAGFVSDPLREDRQLLEPIENLARDKPSAHDCLRRIAFSVYSQTRLLMPDQVRGALANSMTRFGPASSMSDILDELRQQRPPNQPLYFRVPTAPFVLAPMEVIGVEGQNQKIRLLNPTERVLFVSYCLTEDDFLCASVTDQCGHLSDNVLINLNVNQPNDPNAPPQRYKNRNQINDAIQRLWLWIQSVLIMETRNWRLVISRVGKIGHGEFKVWAQILSKSSLRMFNSMFRGRDRGDQAGGLTSAGLSSSFSSASNCRTCAATCSTQELPIILSACLLSMEAEPNFRLFISSTAVMDAAAGGKSKTPLRSLASIDSSITHIIAFPTSPEISTDPLQHNQNVADDEFLFGEDIMGDAFDGGDLGDVVNDMELNDGLPTEITIDHQPMAVGYVVSTAGASELPSWFWNTCPNAKRHLPVHLKNSLHINSSNVHEELSLGGKSGEEAYHPLDEQGTDVLLKHVMKMHNNLSWLNVDVANGSRHSCLPVHMQCLFRLYRSVQSIQS
ncbi:Mediator of RNA polymerase II transcription subunit 13 [Aphelenchoides fujianensis]|nr:Mediator of RNA polymerase II transcription subunit 13 [Aphelenchoides fujianensis]